MLSTFGAVSIQGKMGRFVVGLVLCAIGHFCRIGAVSREEVLLTGVSKREGTFLTPEDFAFEENFKEVDLKELGFRGENDPIFNSGKFEGDVTLPSNKSIQNFIDDSNDEKRAAVRDVWRRWPKGEIPYVISNEYGTYSRRAMARAFEEYHKKSCVKFVPRDESQHTDYLFILPEDGCYSFVGRVGGRQTVSLDGGCMQFGTILHELMHAAGHFHEQSRPDRDDFVTVLLDNVRSGAKDQFEKYSLRAVSTLNLQYDYGIMHYGPRTFSRNGQPTLSALKSGGDAQMGQRQGFSRLDLQKLNKLYDCPDKPVDESDWMTAQAPDPGAAGGRKPPPCKNYKWHCFFWKWVGNCRTDPDYMLKNCPQKCDMCGELDVDISPPAASIPKPTKMVDPKTSECSDSHGHCQKWQETGFCHHKNSDFMLLMCKKSCGICDTKSEVQKLAFQSSNELCRNEMDDHACNQNAFWGMCVGSKESMEVNCKKACNIC